MRTEVRLRAAVAKIISAVKHTRAVGEDIASRAIAADIDIAASKAVGDIAEEANGLVVDSSVEDQVVYDAGPADVGHITTGAVGDIARSALANAAGEKSGLVAGLAEAVSRTRGAVYQVTDVAGRSCVCVDGVVVAGLAGVEATAEGAARNFAELADSVAEGVGGQAGGTDRG